MRHFDKDMTDLILCCIDYFQQCSTYGKEIKSGTLYDLLQNTLQDGLIGLAASYEARYTGWVADKDHAGYLIRVDPPAVTRVPLHLVPVFPDGISLKHLWQLSKRIKLTVTSVICLSGSNAAKQALSNSINDIDFCEYVIVPNDGLASRIAAMKNSEPDVACTAMRIGPSAWNIPWTLGDEEIRQAVQQLRPKAENYATCKFDYLAMPTGVPATEMSNLVILCDKKGNSKGFKKTFAAQEAPLVATNWVPNQFADVVEIGRYASWLMGQIRTYVLQDNYVKALKRCLSLSRLCFIGTTADKINDLFEKSVATLEDELIEVNALIKKHRCLSDAHISSLVGSLETRVAALVRKLDYHREIAVIKERAVFNQQAREIISELSRSVAFDLISLG